MSGLILKGNTISTTGEYLPAPYIEKFVLMDDGYKVDVSVFIPDGDKNVAVGEYVTTDDALVIPNLENLYYYILVFKDYNDSTLESDDIGNPVDKIVGGKENIIEYWTQMVDAIAGIEGHPGGVTPGEVHEYEIFPLGGEPTIYYDDKGREFWKYTTGPAGGLLTNETTFWEDVTDLSVFAFASSLDWLNLKNLGMTEEILEDASSTLVNLQISDIAYEIIAENGALANRYQTEYMDAEDAVYDQTPLQALDSSYYKINLMTHDDIVEYFQELSDEFSAEYDLDDHPKLQTMLNNMALVLETYGEKAELLPQLNALRQVTPDKTPTAPVGKLYIRFRERIYTTNKAIKDGEKLRRTILFNAKIVDLRAPHESTATTSYQNLTPEELIYPNWAAKHTLLTDLTGDDGETEWERSIVAGTFLFDYEKALRRQSIISQVVDVDKLEKRGWRTPYDNFRITNATVQRGWYAGDPGSRSWENWAIINSKMWIAGDFPRTKEVELFIGKPLYRPLVVKAPAAAPHPYPETVACTDYDGKVSQLTARYYRDPLAGSALDTDYRLVAFQLIDFFGEFAQNPIEDPGVDDITSYWHDLKSDVYIASVTIEDTTANLIEDIVVEIEASIGEFQAYYDLCVLECAVNEETGLFNTFFSENILAEYADDMTQAPWIKAPIQYVFFNDLLTDIYSEDEAAMIGAATEISNQINPVNGSLQAMDNFGEYFKMLVNVTMDMTAANYAFSQEGNMVEKVFQVDLEIPVAAYLTEFDAACSEAYSTDLAGMTADSLRLTYESEVTSLASALDKSLSAYIDGDAEYPGARVDYQFARDYIGEASEGISTMGPLAMANAIGARLDSANQQVWNAIMAIETFSTSCQWLADYYGETEHATWYARELDTSDIKDIGMQVLTWTGTAWVVGWVNPFKGGNFSIPGDGDGSLNTDTWGYNWRTGGWGSGVDTWYHAPEAEGTYEWGDNLVPDTFDDWCNDILDSNPVTQTKDSLQQIDDIVIHYREMMNKISEVNWGTVARSIAYGEYVEEE